jgi:hypothetical protein
MPLWGHTGHLPKYKKSWGLLHFSVGHFLTGTSRRNIYVYRSFTVIEWKTLCCWLNCMLYVILHDGTSVFNFLGSLWNQRNRFLRITLKTWTTWNERRFLAQSLQCGVICVKNRKPEFQTRQNSSIIYSLYSAFIAWANRVNPSQPAHPCHLIWI